MYVQYQLGIGINVQMHQCSDATATSMMSSRSNHSINIQQQINKRFNVQQLLTIGINVQQSDAIFTTIVPLSTKR